MLDMTTGMVVLADKPTFGNSAVSGFLTIEGDRTTLMPTADPVASRVTRFAANYSVPITNRDRPRSITLARAFQLEEGDTADERSLWGLVAEYLEDCERTPSYLPDKIGLSHVQRHRRWYISHGAHIQDLLQRNTLLRRMCVTLRWLEEIYNPVVPGLPSRVRGTNTEEEAVLLRRVVFSHIRGGAHYKAVEAAEVARDPMYACILATAQLQTTFERWHNHTSLVALFGEYRNGEGDFASNEHRLKNISELFEDCDRLLGKQDALTTTEQLDLAIAAALSGHPGLEAVCQGGWRDSLWAVLRRVLIGALSKTITAQSSCGQFAPEEHQMTVGSESSNMLTAFASAESWDSAVARKALDTINDLLCLQLQSLAAGPTAVSSEALQIRTILYFLNSAADDARRDDTRSRWLTSLKTALKDRTADEVRRLAHFLLCIDAAHSENLIHAPLQETDTLLDATCLHASHCAAVATDVPLLQCVEWVIGQAVRLHKPQSRAAVFAAFLKSARVRSFDANCAPLEVEQVDAQLLNVIRAADPDQAMYVELCTLLESSLTTGETPRVTLLAQVDALCYRLMGTAESATIKRLVASGLEQCLLLSRDGRFDAVADCVRILRHYGAGALRVASTESSAAPPMVDLPPAQLHELFFWEHVVRVRQSSDEHMRCVSRYALQEGEGKHAAAFSESQLELVQRRALFDATRQVLNQLRGPARALCEQYPLDIAACALWACRCYVECVILTASMVSATSGVVLLGLQQCFSLVEELDQLSLLERGVTPHAAAKALFDEVIVLRRLHGQMVTKEEANAKLACS